MKRPGTPRSSWAWTLSTVVIALGFAWASWSRRWVCDDAFITFRVVKNLLAGNGPVFNAGERVEAYSHPLWMFLIAAWTALFGHVEWGSVLLGGALAATGVVAACLSARSVWGRDRLVPFGAFVVLALPPFWEYATSGLETGLLMAWLGACFALLASGRAPARSAFLVGLGPLIRPDATLFTAAFLLVLVSGRGKRAAFRLAVASLTVPVLYEVFRMGYFAALVPTPAIAKEAGRMNVAQGLSFVADFVRPYGLALPLLLLAGAAAVHRAESRARRLGVAMVIAALLHVLFVVRVGGGFMHGRLLLPALFAASLPLWMVPLPAVRATRSVALVTTMAAWAIVCALWLRVPYEGGVGPRGIADERGYYASLAGTSHPVTIRDFADHVYRNQGEVLRVIAQDPAAGGSAFRRVVIDLTDDPEDPWVDFEHHTVLPLSTGVSDKVRLLAGRWNIGLAGYAAGLDVHVVDRRGLADPIAARLTLPGQRGRPGHEKALSNPWILARFATFPDGVVPVPSVVAAGETLRRPDVSALLTAITAPMSVGRFVENVGVAWSTRALRIP